MNPGLDNIVNRESVGFSRGGNSNVSSIINHDDYIILGYVNRGCWEAVYGVLDNHAVERLAIKLLDPNEEAMAQMEHKKLNMCCS